MQLNLLKNDIFLKTWKLAKAITVKLGILETSLAHEIHVAASRSISWKSRLSSCQSGSRYPYTFACGDK